MISATVLCNNVLNRAFAENIPVTPMKLQKLLYFICSEYIKQTGQSPISESFLVWKFGPVVETVYHEFKSFGSSPIRQYAKDAECKSYMVNEAKNPELKKCIDDIWEKYKYYDGRYLSEITHKDGSAWSKAFALYKSSLDQEDIKNDNTYS